MQLRVTNGFQSIMYQQFPKAFQGAGYRFGFRKGSRASGSCRFHKGFGEWCSNGFWQGPGEGGAMRSGSVLEHGVALGSARVPEQCMATGSRRVPEQV